VVCVAPLHEEEKGGKRRMGRYREGQRIIAGDFSNPIEEKRGRNVLRPGRTSCIHMRGKGRFPGRKKRSAMPLEEVLRDSLAKEEKKGEGA